MNSLTRTIAEWCVGAIELIGITIITVIAFYALLDAMIRLLRREDKAKIFHHIRHRLGGGILLGLEFLIAADIIQTVAVELSFTSVGVLAAIVLVRTFLSFTMEMELSGRWPWQQEEFAKHPERQPD